MQRLLHLLFLTAAAALFAACADDSSDEIPPGDEEIFYFKGPLHVRVAHPDLGSGPNYLVKLYYTPREFDSRKPNFIARTDTAGIARFEDIRFGECYVDCAAPAPVALYDSAYTFVAGDTTEPTPLRLVPLAP